MPTNQIDQQPSVPRWCLRERGFRVNSQPSLTASCSTQFKLNWMGSYAAIKRRLHKLRRHSYRPAVR